AERQPETKGEATVRSLYVVPELRGAGLGTRLLELTEAALAGRGVGHASLTYPAGKPTTPALETVLRKREWTEPSPSMLMGECSIAAVPGSPGREIAPLPEGFQVVAWPSVTAQELRAVAASHLARPWIPSTLLPWEWTEGAEPRTSFALRHGGDLVGWLLTHRVDDRTLRYSCGWVREDLQLVGRAQPFLHLLAVSIREATAAGFQRAVWYVAPQHQRMTAVSLRRGLRSEATFRQTMRSSKDLCPSTIYHSPASLLSTQIDPLDQTDVAGALPVPSPWGRGLG
ncbi:MAG TPA: GNAT family N-acetyltransferase, partial [Chloroflexota bacterium]|nr:GNAT family N-acetyltransferase [Chloroflexota bacterium]